MSQPIYKLLTTSNKNLAKITAKHIAIIAKIHELNTTEDTLNDLINNYYFNDLPENALPKLKSIQQRKKETLFGY